MLDLLKRFHLGLLSHVFMKNKREIVGGVSPEKYELKLILRDFVVISDFLNKII